MAQTNSPQSALDYGPEDFVAMTASVYPASILTTSEKNAYAPINGEASAEEISLQAINHTVDEKPEATMSNGQLVSKIAMLIGLCNEALSKNVCLY